MQVAEAAWAAVEGRVGRASRARDAREAQGGEVAAGEPVRRVPERSAGEACEARATVGAQGGRGWHARA